MIVFLDSVDVAPTPCRLRTISRIGQRRIEKMSTMYRFVSGMSQPGIRANSPARPSTNLCWRLARALLAGSWRLPSNRYSQLVPTGTIYPHPGAPSTSWRNCRIWRRAPPGRIEKAPPKRSCKSLPRRHGWQRDDSKSLLRACVGPLRPHATEISETRGGEVEERERGLRFRTKFVPIDQKKLG
jgi:hypothetical protein